MIAWFRFVISRIRVDRVGRVGWWASITFTTFAINSSRMVTGSEIFIENCSVATMKGVLFSISMTVVVNLKGFLKILNLVLWRKLKDIFEFSCRFLNPNIPKLWNKVPSLDHFVVQNSGDFLCWKNKEVGCYYVKIHNLSIFLTG